MIQAKFTLSKSIILNQYKKVNEFADFVSYSSKTNPLVTPILEKETSCLFSVHLVNELKNFTDFSRILFLAQAWDNNLISDLLNKGIKWFVVDNESDLDILMNYLEQNPPKNKINLLLRLRLKENSLRTEKFFVFGMTSEVVNKRINELHDHNSIESLGIHFHRKTQNMSEWNLQYELESFIDMKVFEKISVINIGGGLPSEYANTNVNVLQSIFKRITKFREWLISMNIKLMIEPGRFIAAPAGKLHTNIIALYDNNIIVNASVYNTDMDALIVPVKLLVDGELSKNEGSPYVIKGVTPCSMDLFRYRVYLNEPMVGDALVFLNAGAYNFTTEFCDLDKLETKIIE